MIANFHKVFASNQSNDFLIQRFNFMRIFRNSDSDARVNLETNERFKSLFSKTMTQRYKTWKTSAIFFLNLEEFFINVQWLILFEKDIRLLKSDVKMWLDFRFCVDRKHFMIEQIHQDDLYWNFYFLKQFSNCIKGVDTNFDCETLIKTLFFIQKVKQEYVSISNIHKTQSLNSRIHFQDWIASFSSLKNMLLHLSSFYKSCSCIWSSTRLITNI